MNKEKFQNIVKKSWQLPLSEKIMTVVRSFSLTEKVIFTFFGILFAISGVMLLSQVNKSFMVEVPDYGGSLTEGVVGSPRFINPVLAVSDIDRDLTQLIYSGLLKIESNGIIVPDLAASYSISDDGLEYTFTLKDNVRFHDGTKVTADDVIYTVEMAQDSSLKSPRKTNWDGVTVEKIDDKTIVFNLKTPYSPFIQNATLGILPKHIWSKATTEEFPFSQFNVKPIGTGPYKIGSITYTSSGLPSQYHLVSNSAYALGRPYITDVTLKSYQNDKDLTDAYKNGDVESLHSISPKTLPALAVESDDVIFSPLPRVFGVFFNQNLAPIFVNKEVRQALNMATDKQAIVDSILDGYGQPVESPVPPKTIVEKSTNTFTEETLQKARAILSKAGWTQDPNGIFQKVDSKKNKTPLAFSISTGDAPELKNTANLLKAQWEALGAQVEVKIFEVSDLNQNIIRTRKYDALLFGEVIGKDMDLYPFWHSSQRIDPGLNIALYTNIKADKLLENIRKTSSESLQEKYFSDFNKEIANDVPAVFTYSPYFIYIVPKKVQNPVLGTLTTPSERFTDIYKWYIETNHVWSIFTKQQPQP